MTTLQCAWDMVGLPLNCWLFVGGDRVYMRCWMSQVYSGIRCAS